MSQIFSSGVETLHSPHPSLIKSVTITNETGGALELSIYRYQDTGGKPFLKVVAGANTTTQVIYDGLEFPDGFSIVPQATLTFYLVEYEHYKTNQVK